MSNHVSDKRICIGKIAGAHGVKGLVKIKPFCDDLTLLNGKLFIGETGNETLSITFKNPSGKHIIAQANEITTREEAQAAKYNLYISREELPETNEDEFYIEDLIGLSAYENNKELGQVIAVENFGAGDLLDIKPKSGASYFVPFLDEYIEHIDLEGKEIHFHDIGGFKP